MLLPLLGAGLGAYQGYREGGLPGAVTGGVVGGLTPAAFRLAGTALMGTKFAAPAVQGTTNLLGYAAKQARLGNMPGIASSLRQATNVVKNVTPAQVGGLLAGTGLALGVPALAGGLAGKTTKAVVPTVGEGVGTARTVQGVIDPATGQFVPLIGDATGGMKTGTPTAMEMLDPTGSYMGALELQRRAQDVSLEGAGKFMDLQRSYLDEAKTRDLARSAAAARLGTELATQQGLTLGGQRIAGAMGTQALGDVGAGLRTQYRYL